MSTQVKCYPGYQRINAQLKPLGEVKKSLKVRFSRNAQVRRLDYVGGALDFHVDGVVLPAPDPDSVENLVGGIAKRIGCKTPPVDEGLLAEFCVFVRDWLRQNLNPLEHGVDVSVESWLAGSSYPEWRKRQLMKCWCDHDKTIPANHAQRVRMARCLSFIKREWYDKYKEARCINSRTDWYKTCTGPYIHVIEEVVYRQIPAFIKHIPVLDRPKLLLELFGEGCTVFTSDHTSFEAHLSSHFQKACEIQLYCYMLQNVHLGQQVVDLLERAQCGVNRCSFFSRTSPVDVSVMGTRMSGDMCTSLGNGFSNLMLMLFCCSKTGAKCKGFVEGDDGIFAVRGQIPTPELFARLGFNIKMRVDPEPASADFCGNVFDSIELVNVPDVLKQLAKFGWSMSEYRFGTHEQRRALLRAKAQSALSSWAGCPVLQELAVSLMRLLGPGRLIFDDRWTQEHTVVSTSPRPVGPRTRALLETKYGLSVLTQLEIERQFREMDSLGPVFLHGVDFPAAWYREFNRVDVHCLHELRYTRRQLRDY